MNHINDDTFIADSKTWTLSNLFKNRETQLNIIQHACRELSKIEEEYTGQMVHIPLIGKASTMTKHTKTKFRKMCTLNDLVAADESSTRDKEEDTDFYFVKIDLQSYIRHLEQLCGSSTTSPLVFIYTILILLLLSVPLRDIVCAHTPACIADRYLGNYVARIDGQMWGVCKQIDTDNDRGKTILDAQLPIEMVLNEITLYETIETQTQQF